MDNVASVIGKRGCSMLNKAHYALELVMVAVNAVVVTISVDMIIHVIVPIKICKLHYKSSKERVYSFLRVIFTMKTTVKSDL